jgi:hypothetical protein
VRAASRQGAVALQALLLGTAGLLPSQRGRAAVGEPAALEAAWQTQRAAVATSLAAADWRFYGVRPASYPPRRLAGLACLLARGTPDRLVADAARALRTQPPRPAARALAAALLVPAQAGYWGDHWDFDRPMPAWGEGRAQPALLGPDLAAAVVVNVLLPLLAAWGEVLDDRALVAAARLCYQQHPPTADNERLRHMRRQLLGGADRATTGTACRQQGLLHVYEQTCGWRRCTACVVGPGDAGKASPASC